VRLNVGFASNAREHAVKLLGARRAATLFGFAGAVAVLITAHVTASSDEARPGGGTPAATPIDCGRPVSSWGAATANDVRVHLLRLVDERQPEFATPSATPTPAPGGLAAELLVENVGVVAASVATDQILLTLCDGALVAAAPHPSRPPFAGGVLAAGAAMRGWVAFTLPPEEQPARLNVPVERPDLIGGHVEFPLALPASPEDACDEARASGDAAGGDAVGGDGVAGEDGGDAIGGDAIGADASSGTENRSGPCG
jgi:hypothetical protein